MLKTEFEYEFCKEAGDIPGSFGLSEEEANKAIEQFIACMESDDTNAVDFINMVAQGNADVNKAVLLALATAGLQGILVELISRAGKDGE